MVTNDLLNKAISKTQLLLVIFTTLLIINGCSDDKSSSSVIIDIPENESWNIYEIHNIDPDQSIPIRMTFTNSDDMLYMSYYDHHPKYDPNYIIDHEGEEGAEEADETKPYRIRYKSFGLGNAAALSADIIRQRQPYDIDRLIYELQVKENAKLTREYDELVNVYNDANARYQVLYQAYVDSLPSGTDPDPNDPNAPIPPVQPEPLDLVDPVKPAFTNDNGSGSGIAVNETVSLLKDEGFSMGNISIDLNGSTPLIAYGVSKSYVFMEGYDLGNQGDVIIGIRNNTNHTQTETGNWRNEIAAFGYTERNPVFQDGLAASDLKLKADGNGNALLAFQFYYEGADSYNFTYPDINYISQEINNFANETVDNVVDMEETIEGSQFQLPSGVQRNAGDACEMVINNDGNPVVFYYFSDLNSGPANATGLRTAVRVNDEWQTSWIQEDIRVVKISAAVKSNGLIAVVYTIQDYEDFDYHIPNDDGDGIIPFTIRYAEQIEVESTDIDGNPITVIEWKHEYVDFVSISGRYCSLALDSNDLPVVAFFDEMNFTENRFFSRIKIAKKTPEGAWDTETIIPEDVGLQVNTSPFDIDPGQHDKYYIGQYNYLWLDRNDKMNICTYSSTARRVYLFQEK